MNPELSNKALKKIEILCEQGCTQINKLLDKAKQGNNIEELADFNQTEIDQIINELDQIMLVYDETADKNQKEVK